MKAAREGMLVAVKLACKGSAATPSRVFARTTACVAETHAGAVPGIQAVLAGFLTH